VTGSAGLSHRTGGGAGGFDYQINPHLLAGIALGGADSLFSVPDRATSGSLESAHVGTYGVARWDSFYAAGAVSFAGIVNKLNRTISAGFSPTELATASFNSELLNGRLELGRTQQIGNLTVTPFAAVQFAELWQSGFTESSTTVTGAPGVLGLTYASNAIPSLPTFLGAQVDARVTFANGMVWSPYTRVSWVHEFEPTRDITATFITLPLATFTVDGPRAASDAVRVDAGTKLAITTNASLFGSFLGEFSNISQMYAGKGGVRFAW
jgi:outer membrane autotransporter protein